MNKKIIAMCATLALSGFLNAAEAPAESKSNVAASKSSEVAATVNGFVISKSVVDQIVKTYVAQGQKDTPVLRKSVLENLINRQVLAQESLRLGLDKTPAAKTQLDLMRSNFLASLVLNDLVEKNPIKDADLKAEYDRQVKALGNTTDLMQYKISHIVLQS
jgi:peptidyl-prolyl cis-trans isomerase C